MARHVVTFPDSHTEEMDFFGAAQIAQRVVDAFGDANPAGYSFTLRGADVDAATMVAEQRARDDKWLAKKQQTHKLVRDTRYGATSLSQAKRWVRK